MKTKDLITRLQQCDPTGELHVGVGNADILFVDTEPAYYDGRQQVLQRSGVPGYDVVGVEFRSSGTKLVIHPYSVWDAVDENPEVPVTYENEGDRGVYEGRVEECRKRARISNAET